MKVNELRVGSLIQWISTGNIDIVRDIVTFDKKECNVNNVSISDAKGVEITGELLIMFGFKETRANYVDVDFSEYELGGLRWEDDGSVYFKGDIYFLDYELKYFHQLQNLYWCLSGQELQIKKD